jgi:uncharacterized protein YegL
MTTQTFDLEDGPEIILRSVRTLTPIIRTPCEMLWSDWREDWETELRRIHQSAPKASLSPGRLKDFSYLCWSIANTWDEVFSPHMSRLTLDMLHQLRKLRNIAAHDDDITRYHLDQLVVSETYLSKSFGELLEDIGLPTPPTLPEPPPMPDPPVAEEPSPPVQPPLSKSGYQKLPVYLLCDRSDSMLGEGIAALNKGLTSMHAAILGDPVTRDKCLLSIIQFNQKAELVLELQDTAALSSLPKISADGLTNYGAAFHALRAAIDSDIKRLDANGESLLRPLVFMISDGSPNDERWRQDLELLLNPSHEISPIFAFYGVGKVPPNLVVEISSVPGMTRDRVNLLTSADNLGAGLEAAFKKVVGSIVGSARNEDEQFHID